VDAWPRVFYGDEMIDPNCKICLGLGWVCENHRNRIWDLMLGGCECGAGMPCECQRANGLEQPDISRVMEQLKRNH
jgi:hypothetical protein